MHRILSFMHLFNTNLRGLTDKSINEIMINVFLKMILVKTCTYLKHLVSIRSSYSL